MRTWRHTCSYLYAGGQRPSPLDLDIRITRCPYCGELEPEHQRELDRQAVAALQASRPGGQGPAGASPGA